MPPGRRNDGQRKTEGTERDRKGRVGRRGRGGRGATVENNTRPHTEETATEDMLQNNQQQSNVLLYNTSKVCASLFPPSYMYETFMINLLSKLRKYLFLD